MTIDNISDVETLRTMVKLQLKESERLKAELMEAHKELQGKNPEAGRQLRLKLEKLEKQNAAAMQKLFGNARSERDKKARRGKKKSGGKQTGHGPKEQPELPVETVQHELNEADAVCDLCSKPLKAWEGQLETSEEIHYIPGKLVMRRHERQKYRCACGGCVKTAPGPRKLFPKARYSADFAISIALRKYLLHLPLDRQTRELKRKGLEVGTNTLWDYTYYMYAKLQPAMERLDTYLKNQPVVGMDETTWRMLKSDKPGHSKKYWVWARRCPNAVHYAIDPSRGGAVAAELLAGFSGTVVCDGYKVYESLASQAGSTFRLAQCWAHARRELLKFEDHPDAARALRAIQWIFRLESRADGKSETERLEIRQRRTKPLLIAFFNWLRSRHIPPTHELKKAMKYILVREATLTSFLDDPKVPPDNNWTERALRTVVLGRKNHYGSKSLRGTEVSALFYSLLESAELAGLNPHEYLGRALDAAEAGGTIPLPHEVAN